MLYIKWTETQFRKSCRVNFTKYHSHVIFHKLYCQKYCRKISKYYSKLAFLFKRVTGKKFFFQKYQSSEIIWLVQFISEVKIVAVSLDLDLYLRGRWKEKKKGRGGRKGERVFTRGHENHKNPQRVCWREIYRVDGRHCSARGSFLSLFLSP